MAHLAMEAKERLSLTWFVSLRVNTSESQQGQFEDRGYNMEVIYSITALWIPEW